MVCSGPSYAVQTAKLSAEKAKREAERRYPKEQNTGANACVFYACNTLGQNPLTRLPDVRPEHITAARTLKRLLTGNLDSSVSTYPPFPWSEAVFLRAQIARIAAATILTPAGWLTQEEGDGGEATLTPAEEFEPVALPDGDPEEWLANWAHKCALRHALMRIACHASQMLHPLALTAATPSRRGVLITCSALPQACYRASSAHGHCD